MNLLKAEVNRFFSRRFIQLMLVALLGAFLLTVMVVVQRSSTPTETDWANARHVAADQTRDMQKQHASCLYIQSDYPDKAQRCEALNPDRVRVEDFLYNVFNFAREIDDLVAFLIAFLAFFGALVAASFVGAELNSGGMTNLLLWRPNRMKVLGTKLAVAVGAVAAISIAYAALYVGTFYGIASTTGWVGNVDVPGFWGDLAWLVGRGIIFAVMTTILAFAIATIGRHTAAALGAFVGYTVVWEIGARIVIDVLNMRGARSTRDWFLATYIEGWFAAPNRGYYGSVGFPESAVVFGVLLAVFLAVAFRNFHRRDLA